MKKKIIFSARDVAAAYSIKNLISFFSKKKNYEIFLITTHPASKIFQTSKLNFEHKIIRDTISKKKLFNFLEKYLKKIKPSFVISGLSGFNKGIDEALIFFARKNNIISFSYQDFHGDVNEGYGKFPNYYLVTDKLASKLTFQRTKTKSFELGYLNYKEIPYDYVPKKIKSQKKILFCGQTLSFLKGYQRTIVITLNILKKILDNFIFIYRPHPNEKRSNLRKLSVKLKEQNVNFIFSFRRDLYKDLLDCDYVLSCYSSSILDLSYLRYKIGRKISSSISLMFDQEIKRYYKRTTNLKFNPFVKKGITKEITKKKNLQAILHNMVKNRFGENQFKNSKKIFKHSVKFCEKFYKFLNKLSNKP